MNFGWKRFGKKSPFFFNITWQECKIQQPIKEQRNDWPISQDFLSADLSSATKLQCCISVGILVDQVFWIRASSDFAYVIKEITCVHFTHKGVEDKIRLFNHENWPCEIMIYHCYFVWKYSKTVKLFWLPNSHRIVFNCKHYTLSCLSCQRTYISKIVNVLYDFLLSHADYVSFINLGPQLGSLNATWG